MHDSPTLALPVLPLRAGVIFPGMVVTVTLESAEARAAADAASADGGRLLLVPRRPDGEFAAVGVIATVERSTPGPDGTDTLLIRGDRRAVVGSGVTGPGDALWVDVDESDDVPDPDDPDEMDELARTYRAVARNLLQRVGGAGFAGILNEVESPGALADTAGWWPELTFERRVELLETLDVAERLRLATGWLRDALAELEVAEQVRRDVSEDLDKNQREYLLRQQLAAIRRELGEDDEDDLVVGYRARLAELDAPEPVATAVEREIARLEKTNDQSAEHGWIRTWLDTILEVPWGVRTADNDQLDAARVVLDEDHTGLDDVKERILEYLAVRKLRTERSVAADGREAGAIVALVGPPGVGKTSLGESIARALGRPFVRVALGGVRDEAEVRGHRRTYVGAQPGRIARAITEAGAMNPVFLLDEIDKVGNDWRGDPSSALLEVLDPAQNHAFRDHYLEVDLDLSDVLFIATANVLETVPGPLLDRLEVITLDGYSDDEKLVIARDHLLPRQIARHALETDEVRITDDALAAIARDYTREAGVRGLEREISKVLRKAVVPVATGSTSETVVDEEDLAEYLKRPRYRYDEARREASIGLATGLAVTGAGGDVLFVEATAMEGEPGLTLTGQLGDVMSESGQIALSFIRSNQELLGIEGDPGGQRFHVHFPAGAVPKDGPSAGVTMTTALVSLLSQRPVRADLGMTGEVTLRGEVLPIGGVKQKLLAAHRAGLREVVIPARNEPDLDDVPDHVLEQLVVHPVDDVRQVLDLALAA